MLRRVKKLLPTGELFGIKLFSAASGKPSLLNYWGFRSLFRHIYMCFLMRIVSVHLIVRVHYTSCTSSHIGTA